MEELDILDFTSQYGDKIWHELFKQLGRNPEQWEYNNAIDFEYDKYIERLLNAN